MSVDDQNLKIHAPLIEECRRGDPRAQFLLYKQYSRAMYNLSYRMMNNKEDAEDMLQEAFIECFRNLGSFRYESTFGAWLKKILINRCLNKLKKKKTDLLFYENVPVEAFEEDYEESDLSSETEKVFKAIEKLPDGYRIILTLYLLEGYDHSEISMILGISESTSKSQYSRGKDKLKRILQTGKQNG